MKDTRPLEQFLGAFYGSTLKLSQFCVPTGPKKERPTAYRLDRLLDRLRAGELSSLRVETRPDTPDADRTTAGFVVAPTTEPSRRGYRYRADVVVGPTELARRGAESIVATVVELADALAVVAGVIFTAESVSYGHALATGARGGLTEEQDRRVRDVAYAVHELDGKIRGPEWGTFLAAHHVQAIGGVERIEAECGCDVVRRLAGGGAYLQITPEPPPPGDAAFEDRRRHVAEFLAPLK